MSELTVHDGLGDPGLQAAWADLVAADPDATIFQAPRYLAVWRDVLGGDESVTTSAVTADDGSLDGVVVESVVSTADGDVRRLGGGTEVTDYAGPVIRPGARQDFLAAWVPRLVADADVARIELVGMASDTGLVDDLAAAIDATPASIVERGVEDVCPVIDVGAGWDAYLEALPGKLRQEQKRKARKLSRDLGEVVVDRVDGDDLEQGLKTFFEMQADAASPKAGFFDRDVMRRFFTALADEFHADDVFRLHVLSVADRPAAAAVSLVHGGRWGMYNSAFDPVLGSFAPGMVLVTELIRVAADEGLATFDLLRGDEDYKYRFGAVDRELARLVVVP